MKSNLEAGHRQLDTQLGPAGHLRKLEVGALKKMVTDHFRNRELGELMAREAILNQDGSIDVPATLFKFKRRAWINKASPAQDARLKPQWSDPGTSAAAPRGSGPAARPPEDIPRMGDDRGNRQEPAKPMMTSAGEAFAPTEDRPDLAIAILRDLIRQTRRAQGLD